MFIKINLYRINYYLNILIKYNERLIFIFNVDKLARDGMGKIIDTIL
jgi:hypothetical protein